MSTLEIFGFGASILIGVSLGLIGGGGSILTLPVLVYLLHLNPVTSTAYSLFIVGSTSLVGSFTYMRKELVNYRAAIVFAIPSFIAVYLTRKYLVPAIPSSLFTVGGFEVTKNIAIMVFFALVMLAASFSMINDKKATKADGTEALKFNYPMIALEGGVVGILTGIVGAGGGFLIIAAKSLIGFVGDMSNMQVDWPFLFEFTALSVVGIFVGTYMSKYIPGQKLKKSFGWFVLVMGVYIIVKELIFS